MRRYGWWIVGLVVLALWAWQQRAPTVTLSPPQPAATQSAGPDVAATRPARTQRGKTGRFVDLPSQAFDTLQRIERGGPYEHREDGGVFQNREQRLPSRPRGYYREYTVDTPGARERGARRIVAGGGIPGQRATVEFFYSDDHYRSFRRIDANEVSR